MNDGGLDKTSLQWSSSPFAPLDALMQGATSLAETLDRMHLIQICPRKTSFPFYISDHFSVNVGRGPGCEGLDAIVARQVAREDFSTAKTKTPNSKNAQRRKLATITQAPPTPILITPPGNGIGTTPPTGEVTQGPSPVDYGLELKVDFPLKMVS
jgi:hypothetical protein